jgi:hypothetical protein
MVAVPASVNSNRASRFAGAFIFKRTQERKNTQREVDKKWEAFLELHQEKTVHWNCFME